MKIICYEIWDFEAPHQKIMLEDLKDPRNGIYLNSATLGEHFDFSSLSIPWVKEPLTMENIHLTEGAHAITINSRCIIKGDVLETLCKNGVKHVASRSIGMNHVDVSRANELGIKVTNYLYNPESVSDLAISFMLNLLRNNKQYIIQAQRRDFSLNPLLGRNISSMTVGIIGTGTIGKLTAKRLLALGCKVLTYSRRNNIHDESWADDVTSVDLDTLLKKCDIISIHCPLTPETYHLIDDKAFKLMKDGAMVINTARGDIIDQTALANNLSSGKLYGAAIDVFHKEDSYLDKKFTEEDIIRNTPSLNVLLNHSNTIVTPHIAYITEEVQGETTVGTVFDILGKPSPV